MPDTHVRQESIGSRYSAQPWQLDTAKESVAAGTNPASAKNWSAARGCPVQARAEPKSNGQGDDGNGPQRGLAQPYSPHPAAAQEQVCGHEQDQARDRSAQAQSGTRRGSMTPARVSRSGRRGGACRLGWPGPCPRG